MEGKGLEVRADTAGLLSRLRPPVSEHPPPNEARFEGIFSILAGGPADRAGRRPRRLPILYMNNNPVFAARSVDDVVERTEIAMRTALQAKDRATYVMHACRVGGQVGLYARDLYNRSSFRSKMIRYGAEFSEDFYVHFLSDGRFEVADWGAFAASFLLMNGEPDEDVDQVWSASVLFSIVGLRMGLPGPEEFSRLVSTVRDIPVLLVREPAQLVGHLSG